MPLYDFGCLECGKEFEEFSKISSKHLVKCPSCGGECKGLIGGTKVEIFKPFVTEDFDDTPVRVESKAHYKELCKKHGVYAPHVFGQGWNRSEI